MNSDAFSHFSLPSNNLLVNAALQRESAPQAVVSQKRAYATNANVLDMNLD